MPHKNCPASHCLSPLLALSRCKITKKFPKKSIFLRFYTKNALFLDFFFEKFGLYAKKFVSLQAE
jgi:hypothetical protein